MTTPIASRLAGGCVAGLVTLVIVLEAPGQTGAPGYRPQATGAAPPRTKSAGAAPSAAKAGAAKARPMPQPLKIEKLDPRMEEILAEWEAKSAGIEKLSGNFTKYTYDSTFNVELRGDGSFYYQAPDAGRYEIFPQKISANTVSRRKDAAGNPFVVKPVGTERWFCTGQEIYSINDADKTYDVVSIPPESQGENIIDTPLPFLFGMKADRAKHRYRLTLLKDDQTKGEVWVQVEPRFQADLSNYKSAKIILETKNYLPKAVQTVDPTGAKESVHTFSEVKLNPRGGLLARGEVQLVPNLKGYQRVIPQEAPRAGPGTKFVDGPEAAPGPRRTTGRPPEDRRSGATSPGYAPTGRETRTADAGDVPRTRPAPSSKPRRPLPPPE